MNSERSAQFVRTNSGGNPLTFWFEPLADEVQLPPNSTIEIFLRGVPKGDLEIEEDGDWITVWSPSGALLEILVDRIPVDCGSSKIAVPDLGPLNPKSFVNLVFKDFPEARPGGLPRPKPSVGSRLRRLFRHS